jgi:Na+-transporting NADH:ubiquinone oxidoreductase subunit F
MNWIEILTPVFYIGLVAVILAFLLVIAEAILANYGTCVITVNGEKRLEVDGGRSLLASLKEHSIFVPSACGGRGTCAYCKVKVLEGGPPLLPTETPLLTDEEQKDRMRLSCQIKVTGDLAIELPEEILSLREYHCTVESIRDMTHDVKELVFKLDGDDRIEFTAGQYVQIETPIYGSLKEPVYRAYSIANPPRENDRIKLLIRRVPEGICTTWVFDILKEGDPVTISGPYGHFRLSETDSEILMIAGSTGIAPIVSILEHMKDDEQARNRKARFFFGAVALKDMFYLDECEKLEQELPNFQFVPALSQPADEDNWQGETGLITEVLDRHVDQGAEAEGYLCGSPGMIDASIKVLNEKGIPEERIYYDKFA